MVPPNMLLRLGTCPDAPKDALPSHYILKSSNPLDACTETPYLGEVRFDTDMMKCYKYTENGWEEIK